MVGSFRKLRIVMVYENEGADLLSVQYPSQGITQSARSRRCGAADVSGLPQRPPSLFRIRIMGTIIRLPRPLRDNSGRVSGCITGNPHLIGRIREGLPTIWELGGSCSTRSSGAINLNVAQSS